MKQKQWKKKMKRYDIVVVGGGAAGMIAAITAARNGASVLILEHMEAIGKKILSTGNGKCNYTNRRQGVEWYYGDDPAFVLPVLEQFGYEETITFFEELGVRPKEKNGYYYPASEQASAVLEVLKMELRRLKVQILYQIGIRRIESEEKGFTFETKDGTYSSRFCIMATGGKAAKKTGSDGSGFLYLERLGHSLIDIVPALVPLQGKQPFFKDIAGIRAEISIDLYSNRQHVASENGELQLTDYGISGIPVFQLSRLASKALSDGKEVYAILNFAPAICETELLGILMNRFLQKEKTAAEALIGMYQSKLIPLFLKLANINETINSNKVTKLQIKALAAVIGHFRVDIIGTKKFDFAQTTAGGVKTKEIENQTLESKLVPGLYLAGEVIDIDGKCGGYNLQWAWASGYVAGNSAAKRLRSKT